MDILSPLPIMIVGSLASFISLHSPYWFFPLVFFGIAMVGFYSTKHLLLDAGILLAIISYLFVNRGFSMSLLNMLVIVGPFFMFACVWFCARNSMMVKEMRNNIERGSDESLRPYRKSALGEIFNNLVIGAFLAILGSILGLYSSIQINISLNVQIILMIFFSSLVFFMIYVNINFLSSMDVDE